MPTKECLYHTAGFTLEALCCIDWSWHKLFTGCDDSLLVQKCNL